MQLILKPELFKALRWLGLRRNPPIRAHVVAVAILEEHARGEILAHITHGNPPPNGTQMLLDKTFNKPMTGEKQP